MPGFLQLLEGFGRDQLERHESAVIGLLPDLTLGYLNPAWTRFARENGGADIPERWGLGAGFLDAMSGPVRGLFDRELHRCLATGKPWQHDYECSSADRYRSFHVDVFPLEAEAGLLLINTLVVDRPHGVDRVPAAPVEELYTDSDGLILQCSYCRRVRRADGSEHWDWVPEWLVDRPDNLTGGLCKPCYCVRFGPAPTET